MTSRRDDARTSPRRRPSLHSAAIVLPLLAATLMACTASGADGQGVLSLATAAPSDAAATPAASIDPRDAALAFAQCMRDHGVDMPDPQFSGDGQSGGFTFNVGG